ncbi:hypothetical protein CLV41_101662 [Roseibium marinum]|uniref:Uncharacterized protein n=2 Tax=Roseibium marinum TaxID=281252 RepID=A0A2S3V2U9_9HYPH|nr:hypothetical protein CLV41_101662 [Roseibium marinum]
MAGHHREIGIADDLELVVDREFLLPKPLDRHIASVTIDTRDNYLNEGYTVELSASFGCESIKLVSDGFEVEVDLSIRKAEIDLQFRRTEYSRIVDEDGEQNSEWSLSETETFTNQKNHNYKIGAQLRGKLGSSDLTAEGSADAAFGYEGKKNQSKTHEASRSRKNWHFIGKHTIAVGVARQPLDGREVDALKGWKAIPSDVNSVSAIFAMLKVREKWIEFSNTKYTYYKNPIGKKIKHFAQLQSKKRKELFELLLKELAYRQLPKSEDKRDAVLAVDALIVKPGYEHAVGLDSEASSGEIHLPSEPIAEFLQSPSGTEIQTLLELGVSADAISSIADSEELSSLNMEFVPQSRPEVVFLAFKEIISDANMNKRISRSRLISKFGRNAIRDIYGLNILSENDRNAKNNDDGTKIEVDIFSSPEFIFKHLATSTSSLRIARRAIIQNQALSGKEIAEIVGEVLGKKWADSSKQRYGSELKRWAIWLEPHIVNPSKTASGYSLVAFAQGDKPVHGRRRSIVTPELIQKVLSMRRAGMSKNAISSQLKTTAYVIRKALEGVEDPYVSTTNNRRLSPEIISKIRALHEDGVTQKRISEIVGLSAPTVRKALRIES